MSFLKKITKNISAKKTKKDEIERKNFIVLHDCNKYYDKLLYSLIYLKSLIHVHFKDGVAYYTHRDDEKTIKTAFEDTKYNIEQYLENLKLIESKLKAFKKVHVDKKELNVKYILENAKHVPSYIKELYEMLTANSSNEFINSMMSPCKEIFALSVEICKPNYLITLDDNNVSL
ncbi:MAG: hypothetical protein IKM43_02180 [Clostridia bacterium]|nr:hypothetical protein [Clostridia bacterium]